MAPGKKKAPSRANNKKKNKGRKKQQQAQRPITGPFSAPNWRDISSVVAPSSNPEQKHANSETIYVKYKEATERFKQALIGKLPEDRKDIKTANGLMDAVDFLVDECSVAIEYEMMSDLKLALGARKNAIDQFGANSDVGHEYFVAVLSYCWARLRMHTQVDEKTTKSSQSKRKAKEDACATGVTNYFGYLSLECAEDDDEAGVILETEEAEEEIPAPAKRPQVPRLLTLDELLESDASTDAKMFLMEMDRLIGRTAHNFRKLKTVSKVSKKERVLPLLVESVAVFNFSMQLMAFLEQELSQRHSHLTSLYRIFAVLIYPKAAVEMTEMVKRHSPIGSEFTETVAFEFIGDLIQNAYCQPPTCFDDMCTSFANKWKVPAMEVVFPVCISIDYKARRESPFRENSKQHSMFDIGTTQRQQALFEFVRQTSTPCPRSNWIHTANIGGGKSLTSTLRLLQAFAIDVDDIVKNGAALVEPGFYGPDWNENSGHVKKIAGEMDSYLLRHVMPLLLCFSAKTFDSPLKTELLTFLVEIGTYSKNPNRPVSSPLAFGAHSLLTAVYELQGDDTLRLIAKVGKDAMGRFKKQLDWIQDEGKADTMARTKEWRTMLECMNSVWSFSNPIVTETGNNQAEQEQFYVRAFWNPITAGSLLLYTLYFNNLKMGSEMVNWSGQLVGALHLYNGLKLWGFLKPEQVPLLSFLEETFKGNKAVWECTTAPEKGSLLFQFLLSSGISVEGAKKRALNLRLQHQIGGTFHDYDTGDRKKAPKPRMPLNPREFSRSYKMLCEHDFSDLPDQETTTQIMALTRAVRHDMSLLNINLACLGEAIDSFLAIVSNLVGLDMRQYLLACGKDRIDVGSQRCLRNGLAVEAILSFLDFSSEPSEQDLVAKVARSMVDYFLKLKPEHLFIFFDSPNKQQCLPDNLL